MTTPLEYKQIKVSGTFFRLWTYYLFGKPIIAPYESIHAQAAKNSFHISGLVSGYSPILEKPAHFGGGWIAVEIDPPKASSPDVFEFNGDFWAFEYSGSAKELQGAYQQAQKDHAWAKEFYNLYLKNPKATPQQDLDAIVLFR